MLRAHNNSCDMSSPEMKFALGSGQSITKDRSVEIVAPKSHSYYNDDISMGTTLIALRYRDGVVIGADSRTSSGPYVVNRVSDKLTHLIDSIYCCRSGSAADTQALADAAAHELNFLKFNLGSAGPVTVGMAAHVLQSYAYNYRDQLTCGLIVAGWDSVSGGQVYSIPVGGMLSRQEFATGGSGSVFVQGLIDRTYRPDDMDREACVDYLRKIIFSAIARDAASGGVVRVAVINGDGVERFVHMSDDHEPLALKKIRPEGEIM